MQALPDPRPLSATLNETPFLREHRQKAFRGLQSLSADILQDLEFPASLPVEQGTAFSVSGVDREHHQKITAGMFALMATGDRDARKTNLFEKHFATLLSASTDDPAVLRHYAYLSLGFFVYVPPGMHLKHPVQLTYGNTYAWGASHIVLIVGKGSKVTFCEELRNDRGGINRAPSGDAKGFWSHAVEVFLEDDAELEYVSLQAADPGQKLWIRQRSHLGKGSKISWRNATLGGVGVDHDLHSSITGADAKSSIDWIAYAKKKEEYRLAARNVFGGLHGGGEITIKGVAEDRGKISTHGMIEILPTGAQTDTYLTQEVLMLDPTAHVDAIPALEIKTNDVKASHSATVARVTEEDLFYFASRGIPLEEARGMFVQGFLGELAGSISDENVRTSIMRAVSEKYAAA